MISFDLKCADGHVFEAWFRSSEAYEDQRGRRLIQCPVCQSGDIAKALMAPAVSAKGNRRADPQAGPRNMALAADDPDDAQYKAMLSAIAQAQAQMLEKSQWVGDRFAEKARAMHYGDMDHAPIHGTTDPQEARAMMEEGVPVAPLLIPAVPPGEMH